MTERTIWVVGRFEYDGSGHELLKAFESEWDAVAFVELLKRAPCYGDICIEKILLAAPEIIDGAVRDPSVKDKDHA